MRQKIYQTVHVYDTNLLSITYKWFMIATIVASLIPLTAKETNGVFTVIDICCLIIYIIDFTLRWISADYKFNNHSPVSFIRYPFRIISVIDLLSIIALLFPLLGWFEFLPTTRILKVFRIVRIFRYSKNTRTIISILRKSKKSLVAVGSLAIGYILISALILFNIEPQTFSTFFDAVYWATVSLTTVGYGDIYPVTIIGRTIAMLSSFFGIAIVALPAGIVTAEYISFIKENK